MQPNVMLLNVGLGEGAEKQIPALTARTKAALGKARCLILAAPESV